MKKLPKITNCTHKSDNEVILDILIEPDLFWFEGHFPEHAILPGVAQIHWVIHYAQAHFPKLQFFSAMERVKFQNPITPHEKIQLTLQQEANKQQLIFMFRTDQQIKSQGKIRFL